MNKSYFAILISMVGTSIKVIVGGENLLESLRYCQYRLYHNNLSSTNPVKYEYASAETTTPPPGGKFASVSHPQKGVRVRMMVSNLIHARL